MSGIDQYTRFYWTVDQDYNLAKSELTEYSGEAYWEYNWDTNLYDIYDQDGGRWPGVTSGFTDTTVGYTSPGKFSGELGFHAYSYIPSEGSTPSRTPSYFFFEDAFKGPLGFSALSGGDYTIDFWFQFNADADHTQYQPIISNPSSSWLLQYDPNAGQLIQSQGSLHNVSCAANFLDHAMHHVEFNGSTVSGEWVNRIFIDGQSQTLLTNLWNPVFGALDILSWAIGCNSNDLRGVDYIVDEIRFSTGIARHIENFTVPIAHYTVDFPPSIIASPTDGILIFEAGLTLEYEVMPKLGVPAITDGEIRIEGNFSQVLTLEEEILLPSIIDGRIRFESLLGLDVGIYGLTVPSITDGTIELNGALVMVCSIDPPIEVDVIAVGTLHDLIENELQLTMSLETVVVLDNGTWVFPTLEYRFLNYLELGIEFIFINGLNFDFVPEDYLFLNKLTEVLIVDMDLLNKVLAKNETIIELSFLNRIDAANVEVYDGFYFSKIHGV